MSSFIYPNSATRKMYGQVGEAMRRMHKNHTTEIETIDKMTKATINELRKRKSILK